MSKEAMGAFIDAVYAIAITILVLEAPAELEDKVEMKEFMAIIVEYAIAFAVLFAFWVQHRRLNQVPDEVSRKALWVHGFVLLMVCLIPRATSLVFNYGGVGELMHAPDRLVAGADMSRAMIVDIFYCAVVFAADVLLLVLMFLVFNEPEDEPAPLVRHSKLLVSALLLLGLGGAIMTSVQNRYFGVILPLALLFEVELAKMVFKSGSRREVAAA